MTRRSIRQARKMGLAVPLLQEDLDFNNEFKHPMCRELQINQTGLTPLLTPHLSGRRSVLVHASTGTMGLTVLSSLLHCKDPNSRLNNTAPERQQSVTGFLEDALPSIQAGIVFLPATSEVKRRVRS